MMSDLRENIRQTGKEAKTDALKEYLNAKYQDYVIRLVMPNSDREDDLINKGRIDIINDILSLI
jgi:hypothetical protein